VLRVAPDGQWTVSPAVRSAVADTAPLLAGRVAARAHVLRVVVSPLGTCVPDVPAAPLDAAPLDAAPLDAVPWDAAGCRPVARRTADATR
jgi:hypothetical protein